MKSRWTAWWVPPYLSMCRIAARKTPIIAFWSPTSRLIRTGFGRFWPDRKAYLGTDERGAPAVAKLHFPGLHPDAARWLIAERQIHAVGLDTASIDHGPSKQFETHRALFEANVPAFENLAELDELPATGFSVVALPIKIRGGSGGPLRAIAILPGAAAGSGAAVSAPD